ncbi:hypothetical protein CAP40_01080 [Sphingomonas sp. IBVSS2]|uniref:DUF1993 domain-containing protein n=1 Tax=Sphingomonas sp. IBVSS2 TaxID=1985172 RepID=UPI000A2E9F22|nr:DUF1993 domain-containing protein [Sphingomonas sp. IBVSS2]OSZ69483.1 hypothetical protein CAP40_01080 [Sphingomonas sp. IBVSS2]
MSPTNLLVPTFAQMLRALSAWLDKARKQLPEAEAEALLAESIAPDMFPLATQVRFACVQAVEAVTRLRGVPLPELRETLVAEGRGARSHPGSIADAIARIDETLALLAGLDAQALDDGADAAIALDVAGGLNFDMTGAHYVRDWALPQFYFHLVTAYAILRGRGIKLGKRDYVSHMLAYVRPGAGSGG